MVDQWAASSVAASSARTSGTELHLASTMGRRKRQTAKTGNGGAEARFQKQQLKAAEKAQKEAELQFYDDPSEDDEDNKVDEESDGSEYGSDQEVLQLGGDDDEDDDDEEEDDDDNDEENDDDDDDDEMNDMDEEKQRLMKMGGQWGKSKKNFYSADTAEYELDSDEDIAKDEESAALELQRKEAEMMDDEDFGLDNGDDESEEGDEEDGDAMEADDEDAIGAQLADLSSIADMGDSAVEHLPKDFSKLSKKDKLQIVNQAAPELLGLISELESTMTALKEAVIPAIQKLKVVRKRTRNYDAGLQYLITRQNLMLNYASNISFYLLLRAEGKSVTDHPVLTHLLLLKKQLNKLSPVDEMLAPQFENLLTQEFPLPEDDGMDKFFAKNEKPAKKAKADKKQLGADKPAQKKQKKVKDEVSAEEAEEATEFYEQALLEKEMLKQAKEEFYTHEKPVYSSDEDEDEEGGKRGATYEIIKNTGLKAHKSKLNRNPRVKKRMQYRKAVIRRKGQVRDVRTGEAGKYGGETTGIKANLSRSRKIRN
ncbi:TPA: hypothetical protein N0F65_003841 [Lagenidium giganteum]|uniref:Sas10 C-terminal domain-containing protein n=1 Tax=Lagenidium giganteum TaxID=4803 RepID=A0AAV2YT83_9STRA|nr:TPA: hypothetical protein N0F65_003841 [Lagenidium giganteum]